MVGRRTECGRGLSPTPPDNTSLLRPEATSPLTQTTTTWFNLGDWSEARTYPAAAEALAVRLGTALQLSARDHLLDIGCGAGDQLLLWTERFHVAKVLGVDPSARSVRRAQVRTATFDNIEVRRADARRAFERSFDLRTPDVIASLDAAYHFRRRTDLLQAAAQRLPPGGRFGLTDLFVAPPRPLLRARLFAVTAGIPQDNLWTECRWRRELKSAGLVLTQWTDLTSAVLGGFGALRGRHLWWPPGLVRWKVGLTTKVAADAHRRGWLGYALITARRP